MDSSWAYSSKYGGYFVEKKEKNVHLVINISFSEGIENQRPFKCEDCGKRFIQNSSLKIHRNAHHPGEYFTVKEL